MIVDRGDLTRLPPDHHHLPVLPEKDRVPHVMPGVESDALQVAVGLRGKTLREAGGSRPLRTHALLVEDVAHDFGEVHGPILSPLVVRCQLSSPAQ